MIITSFRARQVFTAEAHKPAKSTSEIRWYSEVECAKQIFEGSAAVNAVCVHTDDFAERNRQSLNGLMQEDVLHSLRSELALLVDCSDCLIKLNYATSRKVIVPSSV